MYKDEIYNIADHQLIRFTNIECLMQLIYNLRNILKEGLKIVKCVTHYLGFKSSFFIFIKFE